MTGEDPNGEAGLHPDVEQIALWFEGQAAKERELLYLCRTDARPLVHERMLVYKASALSVRNGAWRQKP